MLKNQLQFKPASKSKKIQKPQLKMSIEKEIYKQFKTRYSNDKDFYNRKITHEIISNETAHIVALFKDYLISDDTTEFLQRYYKLNESHGKLPKIYEYYDSCSVIFPNYVILHEAKYICKNIQRKQRLIDNQQMQEEEDERKRNEVNISDLSSDHVFDTDVYDSLLNATETNSVILKAVGAKNYYGDNDDEYGKYNSLTSRNENGNTIDKDKDKDDSINRLIEGIDKCETKQHHQQHRHRHQHQHQQQQMQIQMQQKHHQHSRTKGRSSNSNNTLGMKGIFNTIDSEKLPTSSHKSKNFFLNHFLTTEANKSRDNKRVSSKSKVGENQYTKGSMHMQTASNMTTHKQKQKIASIALNIHNQARIATHKNLFSMPKASPRIFHVVNKQIIPIKQTEGNKPNSPIQKQYITNNSSNRNIDFMPLTSRETNKPKLNLNPEVYDMIMNKFQKNVNLSKKTIANMSTATPSLSLKTQQQQQQQYQQHQSHNHKKQASQQLQQPTQTNQMQKTYRSNQGGSTTCFTSTSQNKKKIYDNLYDKYQKKAHHQHHPSTHRKNRNAMLDKMNSGLFSYDFSASPLTELFKTTRHITFSNDLEKRTDKVMKSFHIKGFEDMVKKKEKGLTICHSNRDRLLSQADPPISKSRSRRGKEML